MARFAVIIEQDEDGVYCASCPTLPGCLSNGDTYESAVANMREAMALHIEVLTEHGDPVPAPRAVAIEDVDIDIAV